MFTSFVLTLLLATCFGLDFIPYDDPENSYTPGTCEDEGYSINHRRHKGLNQCYVIGYRGAQCGTPNARFVEHDETYGKCVCTSSVLAYGDGECMHFKNSQGPCKAGKLWTYSEDRLEATCQSSPCGAWVIDDDIVDLIKWEGDGKCYIENTRGPCREGKILVLAGKEEAECDDDPKSKSVTHPVTTTTSLPVSDPAVADSSETLFGFESLSMVHRRWNPQSGGKPPQFSPGGAPSSPCSSGNVAIYGSDGCEGGVGAIPQDMCPAGQKRGPTGCYTPRG